MGPAVAIVILEVSINDHSWLLEKIVWHAFPLDAVPLASDFAALELGVSALLGLAFLYAAVRLNRADDT